MRHRLDPVAGGSVRRVRDGRGPVAGDADAIAVGLTRQPVGTVGVEVAAGAAEATLLSIVHADSLAAGRRAILRAQTGTAEMFERRYADEHGIRAVVDLLARPPHRAILLTGLGAHALPHVFGAQAGEAAGGILAGVTKAP